VDLKVNKQQELQIIQLDSSDSLRIFFLFMAEKLIEEIVT